MTEHVLEPLIATNSRITSARKNIYLLFASSKLPLSPNDIKSKIKVNKTTVYREIAFLLEKNLITEVNLGDGQIRYESTLLGHHHHLICVMCKKISDVNLEKSLAELESGIKANDYFLVTKHNLEFFGYCQSCQTL